MPYSASYNEPHRAFAALSAYRAFVTGTTSCGPATTAISGSTPLVEMVNGAPDGTR